MTNLGLALPDEHHGIGLSAAVDLAELAERAGFHSIWKGETSGTSATTTLGAVARSTDQLTLGTSVLNVFSRSPALIAMELATLADLADGRVVAGLGVSSKPIVEDFHGIAFDRPLRRLRETIEILRAAGEGETLAYDGKVLQFGPYSTRLLPDHDELPVYNAAMGERNLKLTAEYADGWIPTLLPHSELGSMIDDIRSFAAQAGRPTPTIAPFVPFFIHEDPAEAEDQIRAMISQEMGMGYYRLLRRFGWGDTPEEVHDVWRAGDRSRAAEMLPPELIADLCIYGTAEECREQLANLLNTGVDFPILWLPFGASQEEFEANIETASTLAVDL